MFLPARMRKLKVITLDEYMDSTVQALHDSGLVHIQDISEKIQTDPECAMIEQSKVKPITGKLSSFLMKTSGIIDFLDSVVEDNQTLAETIKEFINPPDIDAKDVEIISSEALVQYADDFLKEVESDIEPLELELNQLDAQKAEAESRLSIANRITNLDLDLSLLTDTEYTSYLMGSLPIESYDRLIKESSDITDELVIDLVKTDSKEEKIIIIVTLKEHADEISSFLRKLEFEKLEIQNLSGTPNELITNSNNEISEIENKKKSIVENLTVIAKKYEKNLLALKEQLEIEKEKSEIFDNFGETERTTLLEAWVPSKRLDEALDIIKTSTEENSVIEVEEPSGDCEDTPSLHDNPRFARPYEFLVDMYNPLKYNEIDPTIFFSIMFPFFFGFCLTDAGYGIIITILGLILWNGLGKYNRTMKSFGIVAVGCGIWSFVLGMAFNGFIGDLFPRFFNYNLPTVIASFDAFVKPQNILLMALIVGFIYLNMGFIMGAYNNYKYGNKEEAWTTQLVWIVMEIGIVVAVSGFILSNNILTILGVIIILIFFALLIRGGGLYGVMDVFSYIGNLLSFARLLALCLATGGFAMTVNILTELCFDMIPFVGILFGILVFFGGHLFNICFQSLGAFVNSLRLHYVEMFSIFVMGTKNKFEAFNADRVYTRLRR